ncbi:MAG: hypothetical protein JO250_17970 [Armatimonadetes bacterium]|nr:hypothetical protein [Armatimonadota bacterium]
MSQALDAILGEPDPALAFLRLEEHYRLSGPNERAAIRAGWDFGRRWSIPGLDYSDYDRIIFAPLTGEDAHGLDAEARIEARLTYHAIENARSDFRDTGMDICLCYHAALRAGLDVVRLFQEAAAVSEDSMAAQLRGIFRWKPEVKSLWAMGFREVLIENGIVFEWIGNRDDYYDLKPGHLDHWGREVRD